MSGAYSNVILNGLQFIDGAENSSGIQEDAYLLLYQDILTLAVPTPGTTPDSLMTIAGPHIMKTGKSPIPLYSMYEKSGMESVLTGEMFSKIFLPHAKFFLPQLGTNSAANFSVLKNQRFIVLIKRSGGGSFIQIGSQGLLAKVKDGVVKTGDGPTGEVGITFSVEAPSVHPYYDYTGILPVVGV